MGEIADMMIDGTLCEGCGAYLGEGDGYPRRCPSCEAREYDEGGDLTDTAQVPKFTPAEPLAKKYHRTLELVQRQTDDPVTEDPGLAVAAAPAQLSKMRTRGLVTYLFGKDKRKATTAVITDRGRIALRHGRWGTKIRDKCPICGKRKVNVEAHIEAVHAGEMMGQEDQAEEYITREMAIDAGDPSLAGEQRPW